MSTFKISWIIFFVERIIKCQSLTGEWDWVKCTFREYSVTAWVNRNIPYTIRVSLSFNWEKNNFHYLAKPIKHFLMSIVSWDQCFCLWLQLWTNFCLRWFKIFFKSQNWIEILQNFNRKFEFPHKNIWQHTAYPALPLIRFSSI